MNKRYIDFVPVDRRGATKPLSVAAKKPVAGPIVMKPALKKPVAKQPVVSRAEGLTVKRTGSAANFGRNAGNVTISRAPARNTAYELEEMLAKKTKSVKTPAKSGATKFGMIEDYRPKFVKATVDKRPLGTMSAGARVNFINVGKVEKRPLSKNVYARKTSTTVTPKEKMKATSKTKEDSKKPVMIIAKPEKDSKVGLIVAVILTIILGAAAGTVAFLLLPK